jgi:surfactin synthase thioesterase subunit
MAARVAGSGLSRCCTSARWATSAGWWTLPGHGESSATSGHYSLHDVADNLAELLQEVVAQPSVIFGRS